MTNTLHTDGVTATEHPFAGLPNGDERFAKAQLARLINQQIQERGLKCEFRAIWKVASPKPYHVRLFPNNLTEYDDGLARTVDNTLPCGL